MFFSNYLYYVGTVFKDIGIFIDNIPEPLRNEPIWASILGAIIGAVLVDYYQVRKERTVEINKYKSVFVIIISCLEEALGVKRQFAKPVLEELRAVRAARVKATADGTFYQNIKAELYFLQFPPPIFHIKNDIFQITSVLGKSVRLMRTLYRLDVEAHNLIAAMNQRNKIVDSENSLNVLSRTPEERTVQLERFYGFPGKYGVDSTLTSLTENLTEYCDAIIHFSLLALRNMDRYSEHFFTFGQRRQISPYTLDDSFDDILPPKDYMKELTEGIEIPEKQNLFKIMWRKLVKKSPT